MELKMSNSKDKDKKQKKKPEFSKTINIAASPKENIITSEDDFIKIDGVEVVELEDGGLKATSGEIQIPSNSGKKNPPVPETLVPEEMETDEPELMYENEDLQIAYKETFTQAPAYIPHSPHDIKSTGLSKSFIEELFLKHLFQGGDLRGIDIAVRTCLSTGISEEILDSLLKKKLVDIKGSSRSGLGRRQMIFTLTPAGQGVVSYVMERDKYVGPAPITYSYYNFIVDAQSIRNQKLRRIDIEPHFQDLVLNNDVYNAIGPAMNSGKALFFYGPPGNGKTAICRRMTNCFGGDVFIPYSILVDDLIIRIYDDSTHEPDDRTENLDYDQRFVKCKRPMIAVGGELTLDDLSLSYAPEVKFYEAPIQMKANNGMLLVDDFGRQTISPKQLLNRWIVPLENEIDYIMMHTGKKLEIPFDVFIVFSTNLDPAELTDDAFLRRVRYKLEVIRPTLELYTEIFKRECEKRDIKFEPEVYSYLVDKHYKKENRPFNACEPRDLLDQVVDLCSYTGNKPHLTKQILDKVIDNYFVRFN
jgi:predicted ATPase with chaperone activity